MSYRIDPKVLSRALRAVIPFASKDETRPFLCAVLLSVDDDGRGNAVATCGHTLARAEIAPPSEPTGQGLHTLIPRSAAVDLERACRKQAAFVYAHIDPDGCRFGDYEGGTVLSSQSWRPVDASFPPYLKVIPNPSDRSTVTTLVGADPRYLARAGKAAADFGAKGLTVHTPATDLDPILFTATNVDVGSLTLVVMPMRDASKAVLCPIPSESELAALSDRRAA